MPPRSLFHPSGAQSWARAPECGLRLASAIKRVEQLVPRLAGNWHVCPAARDAQMITVQSDRGGSVVMIYVAHAHKPVADHSRQPAADWADDEDRDHVFRFSQRRNGKDQSAWLAYTDKLLDLAEGALFVATMKPALDDCLDMLDPVVRVIRWSEDTCCMFDPQPRF